MNGQQFDMKADKRRIKDFPRLSSIISSIREMATKKKGVE